MKKMMNWVLDTTRLLVLIMAFCGAGIFTACSLNDDNPTPHPKDTWDAAKRTFTWQGTPSATVEIIASEEFELENVQIQFTID
jgi:hypothetical protein